MGMRRNRFKKLLNSLFQSDSFQQSAALHPYSSFERLEDRLLMTTVPTQAALPNFSNNWWINNTGQVIGGQAGTPGAISIWKMPGISPLDPKG